MPRISVTAGHEDNLESILLASTPELSGGGFKELLRGNFVITSSAVVRRSALEQAGNFCEDRRLRAIEDWDLWLRVAAVSEVAYLPDPLVVYRDAPEQSVRANAVMSAYWESMSLVIERTRQFVRNRGGMRGDWSRLLDEQAARCNVAGREAARVERRGPAGCYDWLRLLLRSPKRAMRQALQQLKTA